MAESKEQEESMKIRLNVSFKNNYSESFRTEAFESIEDCKNAFYDHIVKKSLIYLQDSIMDCGEIIHISFAQIKSKTKV